MKNLVIVESPTKAKTISKFLGDKYEIKFSMGHIIDLPKSKLGVDIEKNFEPLYEVLEDKQKIINELKASAKKADSILLATDPDREGEAIAKNIFDVLTINTKPKINENKFKRIVFHEITEEAINEAIDNPRVLDLNLVDAQTARRVLDRLVGYQLSPILWKKIRIGLSAGRVQSVSLRLIVEREREIEKFVKHKYWTVSANLKKNKISTEFELVEINGEKIETSEKFTLYDGEYKISKTTIDSAQKAQELVSEIKSQNFKVLDVAKRQIKRSPWAPFTTSTLQQEASRRFGFAGKRTMRLAQKLYEEGFITYHRTDSVTLSVPAVKQIREHIKKLYGDKYIPEKPRIYMARQKLAQEAHEGIRPTKIKVEELGLKNGLTADHKKLYDLIWKRTLASQMNDALIESTAVIAQTDQKSPSITSQRVLTLKTNGSVLLFDGFLRLTPQALQDRQLPQYVAGEILTPLDCQDIEHETPPPPRYNDASLIATLEEKGIGRPSTYASIISTLDERAYIERIEKRFCPTPIGKAVNDFLSVNFSTIDDIPFTAQMEDKLDNIAQGERNWKGMVGDFYSQFEKKLADAQGLARVKIETEETSEKCPECQAVLVIRYGRYGKFLSCSRFPDCKFTKPFVEETDMPCPKDGGKVIVRKTRKGRKFFGCSNYPKCDFAAWKLEDIKNYDPSKPKITKRKSKTTKKRTTKK